MQRRETKKNVYNGENPNIEAKINKTMSQLKKKEFRSWKHKTDKQKNCEKTSTGKAKIMLTGRLLLLAYKMREFNNLVILKFAVNKENYHSLCDTRANLSILSKKYMRN